MDTLYQKNANFNIADKSAATLSRTEISNDRFLRLVSYYLNDFDTVIKEADMASVKSAGVSDEVAFCYLLCAYMGLDPYKKDRDFFNEYFLPSVKMLDVNDYYDDPYYKTVTFDGKKVGNSLLTYQTYAPYQGFVRDDFEYFPNGKVLPKIGFFNVPYRYPAILSDGREWMTLLPNEINSQKKYVQAAEGRVLTYGVGLGYYVFSVAMKENVTSVTAVDMSEDVISLFKSEILPKFPDFVRNKIKIIKSDAFLYAKTLKAGSYDYIYADIWHDCGDGKDLYLKFKEVEKYCPTAKYGYWIEDSIKYYL